MPPSRRVQFASLSTDVAPTNLDFLVV